MMTLCPGDGNGCRIVLEPSRIRINEKMHYHCDKSAVVRAFLGSSEECPHFRKARTEHELYRGKAR